MAGRGVHQSSIPFSQLKYVCISTECHGVAVALARPGAATYTHTISWVQLQAPWPKKQIAVPGCEGQPDGGDGDVHSRPCVVTSFPNSAWLERLLKAANLCARVSINQLYHAAELGCRILSIS